MFWHKNKCFLKAKYLFCNYNIELGFGRFFFFNRLLKPVTFRNPPLLHFSHEDTTVFLDGFTYFFMCSDKTNYTDLLAKASEFEFILELAALLSKPEAKII